jgi:hypothetical protein
VKGFFKMGSHETICPGWLRTAILLISAFWIARITSVSHRCPAPTFTMPYNDLNAFVLWVPSHLTLNSNFPHLLALLQSPRKSSYIFFKYTLTSGFLLSSEQSLFKYSLKYHFLNEVFSEDLYS